MCLFQHLVLQDEMDKLANKLLQDAQHEVQQVELVNPTPKPTTKPTLKPSTVAPHPTKFYYGIFTLSNHFCVNCTLHTSQSKKTKRKMYINNVLYQ